jgi:hypothetical protein
MIGSAQRELLKDFFKSGKLPEGLYQRTLQLYKELAQRAIAPLVPPAKLAGAAVTPLTKVRLIAPFCDVPVAIVTTCTDAELIVPPETTVAATGEPLTFSAEARASATPIAVATGVANDFVYPSIVMVLLATYSGLTSELPEEALSTMVALAVVAAD